MKKDGVEATEPTRYPEHEKLRAVHDKAFLLSEFYDWLREHSYHIAKYHTHNHSCFEESGVDERGREWWSGSRVCGMSDQELQTLEVPRPDELFGLFFHIDPKKLSAEKDAMYQELRAAAKA